MLRGRGPSSLCVGVLLVGASMARADAVPVPSALTPRRALTAGGYDHFAGTLAPSGDEIFFVGNANSTAEIFAQNLERGFPRLLFDDAADVAQPRISPDGRRLLYISYQQDAGGDACVFDLRRQSRRCLTRPGTAVMHVFWFPDGETIGALTRQGADGAHQLRRFRVDRRASEGELLMERSMSAPAVSPDGQWLAFVPLERNEGAARGSLRRATRGLALVRLSDGAEASFLPELPGATNLPAFGQDGAHLYFTQYLNDTNFDGVIDGNDNGVLFRVPFDASASQPTRARSYEQLTSGRTNCQYPSPARERLIATCVRAGYLQIYAMPLEGLVPSGWDRARLQAEMEASRDPWEQIMLIQRMVSRERDPAEVTALYRKTVTYHLALREYESAEHYLGLLTARAEGPLAAWVGVLRELVGHRRAEQRLRNGNLTAEFIESERERLHRLDDFFESPHGSARRLARLAEAEIFLVLGDKAQALAMFDAVDIRDETDASVLHAWTGLADVLLRDLGDRDRWAEVHRRLASHGALSTRDRLHHAVAYIEVLGRGRTPEEELPVLRRARATAEDGSEVALMLDLELALARGFEAEHHVGEPGVDMAAVERSVEAEIDRIWRSATGFERHRAVAMAVIERAAEHDWGHLIHHFAEQWLADVPTDHVERKYAEALYEEVMLERAYVELDQGRSPRELFAKIIRDTDSLEAHVGYIEACLREGRTIDELRAEYRARYRRDSPVESFAEAYLVARGLPEVHDVARHTEEVERARALLRPVAEAMPRAVEVHHLYAYLAHRQYHRTGENDARRAAHARYYLALDLAPNDPRRRASLLEEIGLLQASLGNHRIALRHFAERERLPFRSAASELSFRLAKARSLFHAGSYLPAKAETALAMELVERDPDLARYRPLVLDRAALYHFAAGAHERAVELYTALVEATEDRSVAVRMKARLGLAASAVAAGDIHLAHERLEEVRRLLDSEEPFRTDERRHRRAASHFDRDDYRPLVAGLLALARRGDGDLPGAAEALLERHEIYEARFRRYGRDAYLLELARISHQLAENAYRRGEMGAAREHVEAGLRDADRWLSRTSGEIEETTLALVRAAAELHVYGRVPRSAFGFDLLARVREAYRLITERPNPRWADERYLFPIYLTLMETARR
ncbi:MAG: PD40 domain-containing protein [Myxococcales bacterium]|nr:PD40 domain-containing protein [Myxococcales bacterium]